MCFRRKIRQFLRSEKDLDRVRSLEREIKSVDEQIGTVEGKS